MKRNRGRFWKLETKDDLSAAMKRGAGVAGFVTLATLAMVMLGVMPTYACVDALIFAIGAWFILTKQSRVACGFLVLMYASELCYGLVDPNPYQMRPGGVSIFFTIMLVQAFRASLKWHRLVTVPSRILATEPEPPVHSTVEQGIV
jgi:hypothetical protein